MIPSAEQVGIPRLYKEATQVPALNSRSWTVTYKCKPNSNKRKLGQMVSLSTFIVAGRPRSSLPRLFSADHP